MGGVDARVNDVGTDTLAGAVIVDVLAGTSLSVGDAAKTPRGAVLGDVGIGTSHSILLNVLDL